MPILAFDVYANYDEVVRLNKEIKNLESALRSFDGGVAEQVVADVEQRLRAARMQMAGLIEEATKNGMQLQNQLQKSASQPVRMRVDTGQASKDVDAFRKDVLKGLDALDQYGSELARIFKSASSLAGWSIPFMGVMGFLNQVKNVRSDFQDIESSMQVFLKSEEKAGAFVEDLQKAALTNMFDYKQMVSASQEMIAYGVATGDVIKRIDQLSEIATATHVPLGQLVSQYNKAKALGRVDAMAVQSFARSGLVIKDQLKEMGEAASGTKITFDQLNKVLDHATGEGGMFHGIMASQMNNISSEIGTLQDNMDLMMDEVGTKLQEPLIAIIKAAQWLVDTDNWAFIGAVLAPFAAFKVGSIIDEKAVTSEIQDTMDRLDKLREAMNIGESGFDEDIRKLAETGKLSFEQAAELQKNRNELNALTDNGTKSIENIREEAARRHEVAMAVQEQADRLRELNEQQQGDGDSGRPTYDSDIQNAVETGAVDTDAASELQRQRDILDEIIARKGKELSVAADEVDVYRELRDEAKADVDNARERLEAAQRQLDIYGQIDEALEEGDSDTADSLRDMLGPMSEIEAEQESLSAATELQSAQERMANADRELSEASLRRQALAQEQNTLSRQRNTTATNVSSGATRGNTAATNADTAATGKSTVLIKARTLATNMWSAASKIARTATSQLTTAVRGFTASLMTNPIGLFAAALGTLYSVYAMFRDDTEEADKKTNEFGETAVKTSNKFGSLLAVVNAVGKDSSTYAKAMRDIENILGDYNIKLDDEKDKLEQVNALRERANQLILEEGRNRVLANEMGNVAKEKETEGDELAKNIKKAMEKASGEDAKEFSDTFAAIMADAVAVRRDEIMRLLAQISELNGKTDIDSNIRRTEMMAKVREIATDGAREQAENMGIGDFDIDSSTLHTAILAYANAMGDLDKKQTMLTNAAKKNSEILDRIREDDTFDPSGKDVSELSKNMLGCLDNLQALDKSKPKVKVDSKEVVQAGESAAEAKSKVDSLDKAEAKPITDNTDIRSTQSEADTAKDKVGELDEAEAAPKADTKSVDDLTTAVENTQLAVDNLNDTKIKITAEFETSGADLYGLFGGKPGTAPKKEKTESDLRKSIDDTIKEYRRRIMDADTTNEYNNIKSSINELLPQVSQTDPAFTKLHGLLKLIERRDRTKYATFDYAGANYQIGKANEQERKRQEDNAVTERQRAEELEIALMKKSTERTIREARLNARKKADALEKSVLDEAQRLKDLEKQNWMKAGPGRKEEEWRQSRSDTEYTEQSKKNIGYDTQKALIDTEEAKSIEDANKRAKVAMDEYLAEYGTFQQRRKAMFDEYRRKVDEAETEGERLKLMREYQAKTLYADREAYAAMLKEFGQYNEKKLAIQMEYEAKMRQAEGSPAEQAALTMRRDADIASLNAEYEKGYERHGIDTAYFEQLDNLNLSVLDELREKLEEFLKDVEASPEELEQARQKLSATRGAIEQRKSQWKSLNPFYDPEKERRKADAHDKRTQADTLQKKSEASQQKLGKSMEALMKMLKDKGVDVNPESLKSGEVNVQDFASSFQGEEGAHFQQVAGQFGQDMATAATDAMAAEGAASSATAAEAGAGGGGGGFAAVDAIIHTVNSQLQGSLELLDKWGLSDTEFGKGMKDLAESSAYATAAFDSLKNGDIVGVISNLDSALGSLGNVLGRLGIAGMGSSDITLLEDIDRLTAVNAELVRATEALAEEMANANMADSLKLYGEQRDFLTDAMENTSQLMQRAGKAYNNGFLGIGGSGSSNKKINKEMTAEDWNRISKAADKSVRSASDFFSLTSEEMSSVLKHAPDLYAKIKRAADAGEADAAQFMDDFIEFYKQLEELDEAYKEKVTDTSFDSVASDFKSMLMDMESDTADFTESFESMMKQAVINSLMADKYSEMIQKWYDDFASAMKDGLTRQEQDELGNRYRDIMDAAITERDSLFDAMGWDTSATQKASVRTLQGMSQDTGEALEGRLTAMQIAVEAIRAGDNIRNNSLSDLNDHMLGIMQEYSRFNVHYEGMEQQLAKIFIELQTISENTGAVVKPIMAMQGDLAEIKRNLKNL